MSDLLLLNPVFEQSQRVHLPQIIKLSLESNTLSYELGMQFKKSNFICRYYSESSKNTEFLVSNTLSGLGRDPFQDFELTNGHFIPVKDCDPSVFHIGSSQIEELSKLPIKYWIHIPFRYTTKFFKLKNSNIEGRDYIPSAFVRFDKVSQIPEFFGIDFERTAIGLQNKYNTSKGPLGTLTDNFYFCFETGGEGYIFALYNEKFYCGEYSQVLTELEEVFKVEVRQDQIRKAKEVLKGYELTFRNQLYNKPKPPNNSS